MKSVPTWHYSRRAREQQLLKGQKAVTTLTKSKAPAVLSSQFSNLMLCHIFPTSYSPPVQHEHTKSQRRSDLRQGRLLRTPPTFTHDVLAPALDLAIQGSGEVQPPKPRLFLSAIPVARGPLRKHLKLMTSFLEVALVQSHVKS